MSASAASYGVSAFEEKSTGNGPMELVHASLAYQMCVLVAYTIQQTRGRGNIFQRIEQSLKNKLILSDKIDASALLFSPALQLTSTKLNLTQINELGPFTRRWDMFRSARCYQNVRIM